MIGSERKLAFIVGLVIIMNDFLKVQTDDEFANVCFSLKTVFHQPKNIANVYTNIFNKAESGWENCIRGRRYRSAWIGKLIPL